MNSLAPYKIPYGKYLKSDKYKPPGKRAFKWFTSPMRTVFVTKFGEYQNIQFTVFNPGSRSHIKKWMKDDYDFTFPYYTIKGNIKVDADSLDGMENPAGKMLKRYLKVSKDQSQVGGDAGSLINNYNAVKRTVHSRTDTNGTVTGRFTSSSINLAQIPAQPEFRSLFSTPVTYKITDELWGKLNKCISI